jgi:uncharacterized repeat protein (TIGR01451 family)/uncharacterized delta-60 repeat protein
MRSLQLNISFLARLGFVPLGISAWIGLAAGTALAQSPGNNNFAQAIAINGVSGSTSGSNVGASAETGEPNPLGVAAGESVWYKWTAPANGAFAFTTADSGFDSVLGVYTGTAVNALTSVGEGFDISFIGTQPAIFNATAGKVYYVQVDGYAYGVTDGTFALSWNTNSQPNPAGEFLFASQATALSPRMPLYIASESESYPSFSGRMHVAGEQTGQYGARLTVTRLKGSTGRVQVDYVITNTFYTNIFSTNFYGTNIIYGGINATQFLTNILVTANYQNNEYGQFVYIPPAYLLTTLTGTNMGGKITMTVTNFPATNVPPDFVCDNSSVTDTNGPVPITTTSFCLPPKKGTNIVASAKLNFPFGVGDYLPDYFPSSHGTLVFDDYQMSADIFVPVFPSPLPTNNPPFPVLNHVVIASITNVALDPLESTAIPPPTAGTQATNAMLNILSQQAMVVPYEVNSESGTPGLGSGFLGTNVFNFERATLQCNEQVNGFGTARVYVVRSTIDYSKSTDVNYRIDHISPYDISHNLFKIGSDWEIPLQPGSDYAGPTTPYTPDNTYCDNIHFTPVTGTLSWAANDGQPKFIEIPIIDETPMVQFNEDLLVQLYLPGPNYPDASSDRSLGYVQTCNLTILFTNQPAGAADLSFNRENDPNTLPPYNQHPGPNGTVYAVAMQGDGKAIIGGDFTDYNGIGVVNNQANVYRLARVNTDGSLDQTFNTGLGANVFVSALAIDSSGKVVVGGSFTSFNGISRNRIARVNADGTLDTAFGANSQGADGPVWALAIDPSSGVILMAGQFTNVNTFARHSIARLLPDGSVDTSFNPGQGPDGSIQAISVQQDGRIIIGGGFTHVGGVALNHIARLNADGSLDNTFAPGSGFDGTVYALALQSDGNVVVGGSFQSFNAYPRPNLARLDPFGNLDLSFLTGAGADDAVYSLALQPDGKVLLAGMFTRFNQVRRVGIARLFRDGMVDTSFMDTAYNQFAGIITRYWDTSVEPHNYIYGLGLQPDGNILIAGSFQRVGGGLTRDDVSNKKYFVRLIGGATPGPGNIGIVQQNYSANQTDGQMFITMTRTNGHLGPASVTVKPVTYPTNNGVAGIAIEGQDFNFNSRYRTPTWPTTYPAPPSYYSVTWHMGDGIFGNNNGFGPYVDPTKLIDVPDNDVFIGLIDNTNVSGNRQFALELDNPSDNDNFLLGGQKIPLGVAIGQASATVTIVDPHTLPGVLGFSSPTYSCSEATNALITITRTNGITGLVSVEFQTLNGSATNFIHYRTNHTRVIFQPGDTVHTVVVTNINETIQEGDHTVNLRLYNPSGGATVGLSTAVLTILDNDIPGGYVEFSAPTFTTNENAGYAYVTVTRNGSSAGTLGVQFSTSDGTATNGVNYLGMTNYQLTWNNGDVTPQVIAIPLLDDGVVETNNLTVNLQLSSATLNGTTNSAALIGRTNATLAIVNTDYRGQVAFSTPAYRVNENGGPGYITVVRTGGSAESITVNFATLPGTSTPGTDFYPTNGTLLFGAGEVSKTFTVPIIDNAHMDRLRYVALVLSNAAPSGTLGSPSVAALNIIDDESVDEPPGSLDTGEDPLAGVNGPVYALSLQGDGKLLVGGDFTLANGLGRQRMARLNADGSLDQNFSSTSPLAGADAPITVMVSQTDGRIVLGGSFTNINNVMHRFLARVALNGAIDTTFNPGSGPNNPVYAVAETFVGSVRKLLIGGSFSSFGSGSQNFIGRLNDDGTVDTGFQVAANGSVYAIAVQPDGKALIGGDFTAVNGITLPHVARLNTDGSVDTTFAPAAGANDSVRSIAVQLDGRILIGGYFTNVNGTALNHIARLTARGAVDSTFTPGLAFNDVVSAIALQPDTRIVLGGQFTLCNGVTRHRLTRLNNDGTLDTMINFGDGADSFVAAVAIQTNGLINLGGGFTHYDGQPRQHLARIYGGTVAGAGSFEFTSANYQVLETGGNATLTVRRRGGTSGVMSNSVYLPNVSVVCATDPSGSTAVRGTNYLGVTNTLTFPPGEVVQSMTIPVMHDFAITPDLTVSNYLVNPMPAVPGGPAIGNQPSAMLTIVNVDSGVSFSKPTYLYAENAGFALIPVLRTGSSQGTTTVSFATAPGGTAVPNINYVPVVTNVTFLDGQNSNGVQVPLIYDPSPQGNKTVILQLSAANGSLLLNPFQATLTIQDVDQAPGQLMFEKTNYSVGEAAGFLPVTVLRTNGLSGTVQVNFSTIPGTASPGGKYLTTNGVLTFGPGQSSATFTVPILQQSVPTGDQTFSLVLSNATAGATLIGPTQVPVTIVDDKVGLSFDRQLYISSETSSPLLLTVLRQNGTNQVTTVHYSTTNLTASAGVNYVGITNATLIFNPGETAKGIAVQILHDPRVTGDLAFGVNLFNPSAPAQVFKYASAVVDVLDVDAGVSFSSPDIVVITNADFSTVTNASYGVLKSGTNLLVSVVRANANTGTVSVNYSTLTGANDNAVPGVDYGPTSGTLNFSNGVTLRSFTVQILNNRQIEGDRTFSINLSNPTGGAPGVAQLIPPSTASVTITDDIAGISFTSSSYRVNENGGSATIGVTRSNYTNSTISVSYGTAGLTAVPGLNYSNVTGSLTFDPGDTLKTFAVPVKDDGLLNGDTTVSIILSNLLGNALFINPQAAILTILETDGSVIVPAGSALVAESFLPTNGVIDSGEAVTLLLALRDSVGTNTGNLVATLLATNGITNPSPPQNYGPLTVHGPSVSRPFSFTASGTNGQTITATLQLQDGGVNRGLVAFNYILGQSTASFANPAAIVINDNTAATPYPSTININGLAGLVTKATVTLSNVNHTWPRDITVLLVSPTGQKSYLMAKCGSSFTVDNGNLTFDQSAANTLTNGQSGGIVSGTYRPTCYARITPPFPPALTPPPPYSTNLSIFNGNNPNGAWSLYVIDDTLGNSGVISNGWSLTLTIAGVVPPAADVGLAMTAAPATVVTTSNVIYTLTVANYGPSAATNIAVTDTLPAGMAYVNSSPSQGTVDYTAGVVTWTVPVLATNATASLALVLQANSSGVITNAARVTTATTDPNPDDDTASAVVNVVSPTADLALDLADTPDPLLLGNYLTYTITVLNRGTATATGVVVVDTLPPAVNLISASPANNYSVVGQVVTFTNLPDLGSNAQTYVTLTVQPTTAGTLTDTASCHSDIVDPLKANNSASVKTIVELLPLTVARLGQSLAISWPTNLGNYLLESTTDLEPPAVWTPVTGVTPALVGGQMTVIVPIGPGNKFFRLRWTSEPTLLLNVSYAGGNLIIAWPINPWNCSLESARNLQPPVAWSPVTSPAPVVLGGQNTVTLTNGGAGQFFRLHGTAP